MVTCISYFTCMLQLLSNSEKEAVFHDWGLAWTTTETSYFNLVLLTLLLMVCFVFSLLYFLCICFILHISFSSY